MAGGRERRGEGGREGGREGGGREGGREREVSRQTDRSFTNITAKKIRAHNFCLCKTKINNNDRENKILKHSKTYVAQCVFIFVKL